MDPKDTSEFDNLRTQRVVLLEDSAATPCEVCGALGPLVVLDAGEGDYARPCAACLKYALGLLKGVLSPGTRVRLTRDGKTTKKGATGTVISSLGPGGFNRRVPRGRSGARLTGEIGLRPCLPRRAPSLRGEATTSRSSSDA